MSHIGHKFSRCFEPGNLYATGHKLDICMRRGRRAVAVAQNISLCHIGHKFSKCFTWPDLCGAGHKLNICVRWRALAKAVAETYNLCAIGQKLCPQSLYL
jgi:hypothetical protein